jgi:3-oxoacyl-[acyl-carrier protein] reductase
MEPVMPKLPDEFLNKTIIITGAASGIGRATALIFAREGANVVVADINIAGAELTAEAIRQIGGRCFTIHMDVTDRSSVKSAFTAAIKEFGVIDFQFNCAGSALRRASFLEIDDALWDGAMGINASGVFYCMQEILPHMLDQGRGVIVNAASMSHKRGGAGGLIPYAAAKGAVVTLTMGVAREFADRGIRALSISPGPIDTPFEDVAGGDEEARVRAVADVPMGRLGRPEEIGELVLFMCSDACSYMTADTVYVNGGGGYR